MELVGPPSYLLSFGGELCIHIGFAAPQEVRGDEVAQDHRAFVRTRHLHSTRSFAGWVPVQGYSHAEEEGT